MAKKTSGARASSKKKTTKKASTRKKVTSKAASTKKTTKKTTTKKSPAKATSPKASTSKAASSSKKSTTKKATTKKKTTSKKPSVSKATAKKTTTKKAPSKKTTTKKASSTAAAGAKKSKAGSKKAGGKKAPRRRFGGGDATALKASQDAAARLAAAAGLAPVSSSTAAAGKTSKYKKLTKSPFNKAQLLEFRDILRAKRKLIVGDVSSMEMEALTGGGSGALSHLPQHMADQGSDTFDQSLNLDLAASQRKLLKEIDDALDRIDNGTYGVCELLGKQIKIDRLRHTPWARYSIEAARSLEQNGSFGRD